HSAHGQIHQKDSRLRALSISLFVNLLSWSDARRGRDSVAALMDAGMVLIDDASGRVIGPGSVCAQRVEACFLLVAKPVIEFRQRGLHDYCLASSRIQFSVHTALGSTRTNTANSSLENIHGRSG